MSAAAKCIFCSIVAGDTPAVKVLEDDNAIAFLDHRPVFHGHVLLIPKRHVETYDQLSPEELQHFTRAAQRLQTAVERAMQAHGTFLAINNRVSQSVPHLHMHIVPRRFKDGLRGFFWPRQKYTAEVTMEDVAARIRHEVDKL